MTTTPTFWGSQVIFANDPLASSSDVSARPDNTFVIAWGDAFDELHGRHLNSLGSFTGGDFLTAMSGAEPKELRLPEVVSLPDGTTRVFFHLLFNPTEEDVYVHFPTPDFTPTTTRFPVVNFAIDEFLQDAAPTEFNNAPGSAILFRSPRLSDTSKSDLFLAHIAFNGLVIGDDVQIPVAANETVTNARLAGLGNGNTIVVYQVFNVDTSTSTVRYRIFDDYTDITGPLDGAATPGNDAFPAVVGLQRASNGFVIVTQDALGLRYLYSAFGTAFFASVPGSTSSGGGAFAKAINPKITALNDQGFIIAWTETSELEGDGSPALKIVLQRFGSNGLPIGDNVFINSPGDQGLDSIATLDDGRVILTYSSETGDSTNLTTLNYQIVDPREATLFGSNEADNIVAREDGSTIFGFDGDDDLFGREAADLLNGGGGGDDLAGAGGIDSVTYVDALARVKAALDGSFAGEGEGLGDTFSSIENMTGSRFGDVLRGDGLANRLTGNAGADTLQGMDGDDTIEGGRGGDAVNGGNGTDTASYAAAAQRVKASLDGSIAGEGDAAGDIFTSIERFAGSAFGDVLRGDGGVNLIKGGGGADTIQGMAGNDSLYGEAGADALTGGLGNDFFNYVASSHGGDTIKDFHNIAGDNDTLRFLSADFGGLPAGPLAANRFVANASGLATSATQRFVYETDTGILRFDANGSGAGGAELIATLTGAPLISAADIAII